MPSHVSETAKIAPVTGSITGVLVIPTVGEMLPQNPALEIALAGTGVPAFTCQTTAPLAASRA